MKILKLIMRNINSLYGTWEIDFTAPEYAAGLFAITGSTGSGKSTILDAMSLALFAETPRIGHGSNTEVVSRGTADCLAELTFESGGDLYMASFSFGPYRRGPRKGQLNESYLHKLAKNGVEIADKTSAVRKAVEEVTGLDKDRFTRTVMLAQGKFDAFLNAGDAKAAILEQITGTEIYSRIAAMVRQIATSQTAELERLRAAACGIQPLTAEEEQQKQNELAALDIELTEKKKEYAFALAQMNLRENLEKLNTARMKNNAGQESLQQEKSVFAPLAIRLSEGRKAEPVRHLYLELTELRRKNRQLLTELEQLERAMPELEKNAETAKTLSAQATGKLENLKKNQAALQETTNKVRLLDAALADGIKQIRRIHSTMEREQTQIANCENARLRAESGLADLNEKRKVSESYCSTHSGDAILPEKAAEWNSALQYILERRAAALLTGKEKDRAVRELEHAQTAVAAALQTLKNAEDAIRQPAMEVDTLRQQISASETRQSLNEKQDILQRNLRAIQMIMDHAEARKHLQPGTPCPLCGATEHPYADPDVIPVQDQNEKDLDEIRQKLTALDRLEQQLRNAENALHAAENKVQQAQNNREIAEQKRNYTEQVRDEKALRYEEEIRNGKAKWEELKNALSAYGFELAERAAALPDAVAERIRAYREAEKSLQDFEQDQTRLQSEHAFAVQGKTDAENRLKDAEKEQNDLLVIQEQKKQERTDLFGDQDPDREWEKCLQSVQSAETEQHTAHAQAVRAESDWKNAQNRHGDLRAESGRTAVLIRDAEQVLREKCTNLSIAFDSLAETLLDPSELAQLAAKDADLTAREKNLAAEKLHLETEIADMEKQIQTDMGIEDLRTLVRETNEQQNALSSRSGAVKQELVQNDENKKRRSEKQTELENQQKQEAVWGRLNQLIGRGNQFQRIAQGITLDNLLALANGELKSLYPRYELIRSEKEQLEIDVVDHEQGDEIRTCANLSGGEKFVVSLALALGLSRMAGEKIRIDSFFLDEGFGTLDSESLQIVMHALSKLCSGGKLVGIISHVSNLADEIPCVISVTKNGGGKSSLSGPGVSEK